MKHRLTTNFVGRGKPRAKVPSVPANESDTLTAADAASLISGGLSPNLSGPEWTALRNKVRGRIDTALDNKRLDGSSKAIKFTDLVNWVRYVANDLLSDTFRTPVTVEEFIDEGATGHDVLEEITLPASLQHCHKTLKDNQQQINSLLAEIKKLKEKQRAK